MIDLIEYIVAELKSKRLSRAHAASLVKQFSQRHPSAGSVWLHPLVQQNTSDLTEQRYSSVFHGTEFFLADHTVQSSEGEVQPVLPAAAYLEMARAAVEQANPRAAEGHVLELTDIAWAQPIVLTEKKTVHLAVLPNEGAREPTVDFEIYTSDGGKDGVHCQGRAIWRQTPDLPPLNLPALRARMPTETLSPAELYARFAAVGLLYGDGFRTVEALRQGKAELLAALRLPALIAAPSEACVMPPAMLDGALQAAVGLLADTGSTELRLPFALEKLTVLCPCMPEMLAWVRFAPGSHVEDAITKVDLDLADLEGKLCVQMRGFCARAAGRPAAVGDADETGILLAAPQWIEQDLTTKPLHANFPLPVAAQHVVLLCGLPAVDAAALQASLPDTHCESVPCPDGSSVAARYTAYALGCFGHLRTLLSESPGRSFSVQILGSEDQDEEVVAGLSGLLRTASLENPQVSGTLILLRGSYSLEQLGRILLEERHYGREMIVRYGPAPLPDAQATRQALIWKEVASSLTRSPVPTPSIFKDLSTYLITGGLGGLGLLFAREILERTSTARVIVTGRSPLTKVKEALLHAMPGGGNRIAYRQMDLADRASVESVLEAIRTEFGPVSGVLHSAGMVMTNYILHKEAAEFSEVLEPKVTGLELLDSATRNDRLEFFTMFSSLGALGNMGMADYAVGNAFMDRFAALRNRQAAQGLRHGVTRSINWPLWAEGGMGFDSTMQQVVERTTGHQDTAGPAAMGTFYHMVSRVAERLQLVPLQTAQAMSGFYIGLALPCDQFAVLEGDLARIRHALSSAMNGYSADTPETLPTEAVKPSGDLQEKTHSYLRRQLSSVLKIPVTKIDRGAALEEYGMDSILAMRLTNELEKDLGPLSKTLFFEYRTLNELTARLLEQHRIPLAALLGSSASQLALQAPVIPRTTQTFRIGRLGERAARFQNRPVAAPPQAPSREPIAIVGLSGRYPESPDIASFWQNLRSGKDCITEVPPERWDWRAFLSEDRAQEGRHFSKWGGFIAGVDEFDPLFFNVSPTDAVLIDPQERLFLQHAWMAMEDAGYTRSGLQATVNGRPSEVGVYVGLMYSEYQLFGAEISLQQRSLGVAGSAASVANRVSYTLNLHGPSMTVDTMCSASLTAIHLACQDLRLGRTNAAFAGGVNVSIHPNKYLCLSAGQFISSDGHCQSFGVGGDGYIPGEGVGVVLLKRLADAERDGDHIYGVIRGSTINHGGRTNGYSVPNPHAQTSAIQQALLDAQVQPGQISYVEAHGTGTRLGDPIEIAALERAFGSGEETSACLIGSVKSNIGHCESAAAVAGLTKILLQMRYREIVPSLHSAQLNPYIDFARSPFVVNQTLSPWTAPIRNGQALPRMAGLSSFGAGGSNAHLIVEEYQVPEAESTPAKTSIPVAIVLSARTTQQLEQKASDLLAFVRNEAANASLTRLAFTLQQGREPMEERLGFIARSGSELALRLEAFLSGQEVDELFRGQKRRGDEALNLFNIDADLQQMLDKWLQEGRLNRLLELWVKGVELDWARAYPGRLPQRMSLPTYPFSRERFWLDTSHIRRGRSQAAAVLHPLLHRNVSDLREQCFASTFTGQEPFLADHGWKTGLAGQGSVSSASVLPAAAFLEMVRAAVEFSLPMDSTDQVLFLKDTVWLQPLVVNGKANIRVALRAQEDGTVFYRAERVDEQPALLLCEGHASWTSRPQASRTISLAEVRAAITATADHVTLQASAIYQRFIEIGLLYGPSHRTIQTVTAGNGRVLAHLRLPANVADEAWGLPPSLLDGAFQACAMLLGTGHAAAPASPSSPLVPVGLKHVSILRACPPEMFAVITPALGASEASNTYAADIDLCDSSGSVCVELRGFMVRSLARTSQPTLTSQEALPPAPVMGTLFAAPAWRTEVLPLAAREVVFDERHILLCGLTHLPIEELNGTPHAFCAADTTSTLPERYTAFALECFERMQSLMTRRTRKSLLIQVVVPNDPEGLVLTALTGLLQTAMLEEPSLRAQMLAVPNRITASALNRLLLAESTGPLDVLVHYEADQRKVLYWREVDDFESATPLVLRDRGVYLITGGLGGLGTLFAQDLLRRTQHARIILTGRSPLSPERRNQLEQWPEAARVDYHPVDLGSRKQVDALITAVLENYGRLDGILHSAGMTADSLLRTKTSAQFAEVLHPKVSGTANLDAATAHVDLDFIAFFSSVAGVMGNPGQADYAAANAFLDRFAVFRNLQVAAGVRYGITRSINWPLWQAGGMTMPAQAQEQLFRTTGMVPLETGGGVRALYRSLNGSDSQTMVVEGDLARMRRALTGMASALNEPTPKPVAAAPPRGTGQRTALLRVAEDHLREQVAALFRIPAERIRPEVPFEEYGIDSVLIMKLTARLEETFGTLSKTLLFEYQTLGSLASFLVGAHPATLERLLGDPPSLDQPDHAGTAVHKPVRTIPSRPGFRLGREAMRSTDWQHTGRQDHMRQDIAIIGMAGRYPQAEDVSAFWANLRNGRDSITEIPHNRWDHAPYFSADRRHPGKSYSRWGGFLEDVDTFDARFFNISPKEAELIDPQERLFLQTAWHTFEDAGYRKEQMAGRSVGVYVGVMWSHYELLGAEALGRGGSGIPSSSHASIANRVSYFLNLQGPSLALDTMCSSSLTAIHLACEALRNGTIEAALAGGVNLTLHPYKYLSLSQGQFVASDGRCRSFGEGGDGYVPGEGVGAVLLKPLANALRDGDRIHALIRGSSINHGGKTNGYTVPNPVVQGALIREALRLAEVEAGTIGYIEAHGTGTSLGDPIEMTGLTMAFAPTDRVTPPCALGSVKSNIGHLEAAAGIAALTKTVLQLQHRELVPSLHAESLNPHIEWNRAPLRVQTSLAAWPAIDLQPRRAGISSFGAGGANAHLILEEFRPAASPSSTASSGADSRITQQLLLLSAHDPDALVRYAETWRVFCDQPDAPPLADTAYTSQVGRTALPVRLAILAHTPGELSERLGQWSTTAHSEVPASPVARSNTFYGDTRRMASRYSSAHQESADHDPFETLLEAGDLSRLATAWVSGSSVDWSKLSRGERPRRVAIPLYPFARERYWLAPSWSVPPESMGCVAPSPVAKATLDVEPLAVAASASSSLLAAALDHLQRIVSEEIRLESSRIDPEERLESLGMESIALQNIHAVLSRDLGDLPPTLFYEHGSLMEVARFLLEERRVALMQFFSDPVHAPVSPTPEVASVAPYSEKSASSLQGQVAEPIAIVGLHGAFPQAPDLETYWTHLRNGKDLVQKVPAVRWDADSLFDPNPDAVTLGKIYCKWGGFLEGVDEFDPAFFRISHEEACSMDPQERLFLQSVWAALEDAGYTRERLTALYPSDRSAGVGVFVGVTNSSYQLWAAEEHGRGNVAAASSLPWSIANRVSYFFDFNGPSIPVDTACSSSLVAVHLACESLRRGECGVSIAGGVNLYLHPTKYQQLCARNMLASQGRCRSYGAGDDGFVPGEAVGTLILKRLSDAVQHGDRIHAVITGSGYEHAGRAHGYSAPNPTAQTRLIRRVLNSAQVSPASVSYVEGHGTGTQMGDSLEVAALTEAFLTESGPRPSCSLGSVKTNIGHTEAAAGIAGIAKVVLQIRHKELAPSLHAQEINPGIDFQKTPFTLQQQRAPWQPAGGEARRALINAFGAGGVNACVLIEEYQTSETVQSLQEQRSNVAVLSARNESTLRSSAARLLHYLQNHPATNWDSLCFTLQSGREAMEERLAIPAAHALDLADRLDGWLHRRTAPGVLRGTVPHPRSKQKSVEDQPEPLALARRWVAGEGIEWQALYQSRPAIASLPTYPFEKQRCWFSSAPSNAGPEVIQTPLHPLVAYNSSTMSEISFTSVLSERGYLGSDHRINAANVLPGAAFLEIACLAGTIAGENRVLGLRDLVWIQPLVFQGSPALVRTALRKAGEDVEYVISTLDELGETTIHSEGRLFFRESVPAGRPVTPTITLTERLAMCTASQSGQQYYAEFALRGFAYGPAFQPIREIHFGPGFALARMELPQTHLHDFNQYLLHPALIDGALQTAAGLLANGEPATPHVPFALDEIRIHKPLPRRCYSLAIFADSREPGPSSMHKFHLQLLSEAGEPLVDFKNLFVRALSLGDGADERNELTADSRSAVGDAVGKGS